MSISVHTAEPEDFAWVNKQYDEVGFPHSDVNNDLMVLAEVDGTRAGLGRLVRVCADTAELGGIYVFNEFRRQGVASKVVRFLVEQAHPFKRVYCLPFENLHDFYASYGFVPVENLEDVPEKVRQKHEWCNTEGRFESRVLLMELQTTTPE